MSGGLDDLVTEAAAKLMAATAADHAAISEQVVADTVSQFGVDFGFLRHNDHTIQATVLVALWPRAPSFPILIRSEWCISLTPTRFSRRPKTSKPRRPPARPCKRGISAQYRGGHRYSQQHHRMRAAALRECHNRHAGLRQDR